MVLSLIMLHLASGDGNGNRTGPVSGTDEDKHATLTSYRAAVLATIYLTTALFWTACGQYGGALLFWVRDHTERRVLGWEIPTTYFAGAPAALVVLLSPVLARACRALRAIRSEPSSLSRLLAGLMMSALAFILLTIAAWSAGDTGRASIRWMLLYLVAMGIGELLVMPLGLSLVSRLAPRRMAAMLTGIWYLALSSGAALSGLVGELWSALPPHRFFGLLAFGLLSGTALLSALWSCLRTLRRADDKEAARARTVWEPKQPGQ